MNNNATSPAHTASPWTLENMSDEGVFLELKGDHGSKPIAHIYESFFSEEHDVDEEERDADAAEYGANASLILAAPDLLAGCEQAVKDLCFLQGCLRNTGSTINRQKTIDQLVAVIAKATSI